MRYNKNLFNHRPCFSKFHVPMFLACTLLLSSHFKRNVVGFPVIQSTVERIQTTTSTCLEATTAMATATPIPACLEAQLLMDLAIQNPSPTLDQSQEMNRLIQQLIAKRVSFDPMQCINGPLFCTLYTTNPQTPIKPLWERISSGSSTNLKGQEYRLANNNGEEDENENTVVNYAEILGRSFHVKAFGTFVDAGPVPTTSDNTNQQQEKTPSFPFNLGSMLFPSSSTSENPSNRLRTCPYDYNVTATGASITAFGLTVPLAIRGTGTARVIYADPCLRIFVSPGDTQVDEGAGDWERAGLISIQVRVTNVLQGRDDLVEDDGYYYSL